MRDEIMGRLARLIKGLNENVKEYEFKGADEDDVDHIDFEMAMEMPIWQVIYDIDPKREIDVRMTYADLAEIYRRMA